MTDDRRGKFSFQISIGDVITIASVLLGGSALYFNLHEEVSILRVKQEDISNQVQEVKGKIVAYEELLRQEIERGRR